MRNKAWKSFWKHTMELLGNEVKWNLVSVRLEIVLVLVQDRCTVCAEQGSDVISEAHDGTPR